MTASRAAMEASAVYSKLTEIMREVFEDDAIVAAPELSADDVAEWDSLSHLRLMMTVQKAFAVKLSAREIGRMDNVGDLAAMILAKTA